MSVYKKKYIPCNPFTSKLLCKPIRHPEKSTSATWARQLCPSNSEQFLLGPDLSAINDLISNKIAHLCVLNPKKKNIMKRLYTRWCIIKIMIYIEENFHIPCTSITVRAPRVIRAPLSSLPLTKSTMSLRLLLLISKYFCSKKRSKIYQFLHMQDFYTKFCEQFKTK